MRTIRGSGPFARRPFFTDDEIERIAVEELDAAGLLPPSAQPIRIERFVEKRFRLTVRYDNLPRGILGYTQFGPNGVEAIVVSRALGEDRSRVAERRINSTLAHEAGHGLLHSHLFIPGIFSESLFDGCEDVSATQLLCRQEPTEETRLRRYDGRWWEYQANRLMGALLLPQRLVYTCIAGLLVPEGQLGTRVLPDGARGAAARELSDIFDVNPIVAKIRLGNLFRDGSGGQLTL